MKLRMTGFERSPSFVIRLGNKPPQINEDGARHQTAKLVSVFHKNLMSFPINFDVVFFYRTLSFYSYNTKIYYKVEFDKLKI